MEQFKLQNKAQIAAEFLIVMGLLIFIFIGLVLISIKIGSSYKDLSGYLDANSECLKISNIISSVQSSRNLEANFKSRYLIDFDNYTIIVKDTKERATCTYYSNLIINDVTGNIKIENSNGLVKVTNVTS